jgi:hypothetical protein
MIVTLEFSAAEEAKLRKKAEEQGVTVEKMLKDACLALIAEPASKHRLDPNSEDPFEREITALQKYLPKDRKQIPDEALRRENLYADED